MPTSRPEEWWAQWYSDRAVECRANAACGGPERLLWRRWAERYEAQAAASESRRLLRRGIRAYDYEARRLKRLIRRAGPRGLAERDFDRLFYRTNFGTRVCRLRLRPIDGDAFLWGLDELAPRQRNTNLRLLQVLVQLGEVQTSRCPERGVVYRLVAQT